MTERKITSLNNPADFQKYRRALEKVGVSPEQARRAAAKARLLNMNSKSRRALAKGAMLSSEQIDRDITRCALAGCFEGVEQLLRGKLGNHQLAESQINVFEE